MLLIQIKNLEKSFGDKQVIDIPDLEIYAGDKIGIIGENGCGKTTFLNLLTGRIEPDQGQIRMNASYTYLRQFRNSEFTQMEYEPNKEYSEFHVKDKWITKPHELSGGEYMRLMLAKIFAEDKKIIIADEPTTNLDLSGIAILKEKLMQAQTLILVSHDRDLLESCCNKILEFNRGKLTIYDGTYSNYVYQKELKYNYEMDEYEEYVKEKDRLTSIYQEKIRKANKMSKKPKDKGSMAGKEMGTRSYKSRVKSMESSAKAVKKRMEQLEKKEKPKEASKIKIDFRLTNPPENRYIIRIEDFCFSYEDHVIFEQFHFMFPNRKKIAIYGPNGIGKTTLLKCIVNGDPNIHVVPKVKFGYFDQELAQLDLDKDVLLNAQIDSVQEVSVVRTMLARLLFSEDMLKIKVRDLSGGERVKLGLAKLLLSDANVLLLDEPTNYLDLNSRIAVEKVLVEYEGSILFVSHDKNFVASIADQLIIMEENRTFFFDGRLEEYMDIIQA